MEYDAVVLAGGAARRLGGADKAGITVGGARLLDRVLDAAAGASRTVVVGPERRTRRAVAWTREAPPGSGPAAAIAAGVAATSAPLVVVLAVDLPLLDPATVEELVAAARGENRDGALLVDREGRDQFLAGAYRRAALEPSIARLGDPAGASARALVAGLDLARVPAGAAHLDCDTWEDVAAARHALDDRGGRRPARNAGERPRAEVRAMAADPWARLHDFAARRLSDGGTPGAVIAVTDRDRTLWTGTHGFSDVGRADAMTPDALFEIGSIGKSFTAISLLLEAERGGVDLHAPVTDYLPWFEVRSRFEPISLHHLLCHTGGITTGRDFTGEAFYEVWSLRHAEAGWPPGERYHYSNLGFKTLGLVLEGLFGAPYPAAVTERVLAPLGMNGTHAAIARPPPHAKAIGYEPAADDRPWVPGMPLAPAPLVESATGDGCIVSCAADMAAYVRMLLRHGRGLLQARSWDRLTAPASFVPEEAGAHYGYGVAVWEEDGRTHVGHGGSTVGFHCQIDADLDAGVGSVVLLNGPGPDRRIAAHAVAFGAAVAAGESPPDPPPVARDVAPYAGTYSSGAASVTVADAGERLVLRASGDDEVGLHPWGDEGFVARHPSWELFPLVFDVRDGRAAGFRHGPDYYAGADHAESIAVDPAWRALEGHYRAHNPWYSNFRVVMRRDELVLIWGWGEEAVLRPAGDGWRFADGPDRIAFEAPTGGAAARARFESGGDYFRTFTP